MKTADRSRAIKRGAALLLAAVLTLGLAACGGAEKTTGAVVYAPESVKFHTPLKKLENACRSGGNLYLAGTVEEKTGEEASGSFAYDTFGDRYLLARLSPEGGEAEELTAYQPGLLPEGVEGELTDLCLRPGPDGTVWVAETLYVQTFDLPEDFDSETGERWKYISSSGVTQSLIQLDSAGNELFRFDGCGLLERLEAKQIFDIFSDGEGSLLVNTGGAVFVLDREGDVKTIISCPEEDSLAFRRFLRLPDGRTAISFPERSMNGMTFGLQTLDLQAEGWGEDRWALPGYNTKVFPGDENALFYYVDGDNLFAWREGAEEAERLLGWSESGIDAGALAFFSFQEDGRLMVMAHGNNNLAAVSKLALLTPTDAAALPQKRTLTFGVIGISGEQRAAVANFNRESEDCYITVRDYLDENAGEDRFDTAKTRFLTDIMTGNCPDIVSTTLLPVAQCGGKGYLENLWPYIENDPDLGREKLMDRVLTAMEHDGKLYHITDTFAIKTLTGAKDVVGDRMTWTIEDFRAALATMPEGCIAFDMSFTASNVLRDMLSMSMDRFVDWEAGTCDFTGEAFQNLLEFCGEEAHPDVEGNIYESPGYMNPFEGAYTRQQMLVADAFYFSGFEVIQEAKFMLGGEVSFIGFPNEEGKTGSYFYYNNSMAMSSACEDKEAAWSFLRTLLLPQDVSLDQSNPRTCVSRFYVNRESFEKMAELVKVPRMMADKDGKAVEVSRGSVAFSIEGEYLSCGYYATTQEEYDQIMALYNAIDSAYEDPGPLADIAVDLAGAYFAGDRSLEDTCRMIQSRAELYMGELQ